MQILPISQNSPEWHQARAKHFTASEAPAMLGLSKYKTRSALLREKATGVQEEVDSFKQAAFDRGHAAEAVARPLVEAFLQEDLFPCTGTLEVEGLPLLASFDGLTMDEFVPWENKLHNDSLAAMIQTGDLDGTYWPQCEHQLLVSGASRALFTTCDGEKIVGQLWYESKPERRAQLIAGWKQFSEDLKNYTPPEVIPAAVAEPQMALPALAVQVNGEIAVRDNLAVFGDALRAYVERINKEPSTDQDFADLEATVKTLKAAEDALEAAKASALGQVSSIDTMKRTADQLQELARANRLTVEKLVKAEKENRRNAIVQAGVQAVSAHISRLNQRLTKPYMPPVAYDFGAAVRGLKTISSIQNAVDTELARAKIAANEIADRIQINLAYLRDNAGDYKTLFSDAATLVLKAPDDMAAAVKLRISEHKEAEEKRLDAEREKIRAEEAKKAADEQAAKLAGVMADHMNAAQAAPASGLIPASAWPFPVGNIPNTTATPAASVPAANAGTGETPAPVQRETPPAEAAVQRPDAVIHIKEDDGRTMRLGEISEALGMTVTADFLAALGFAPVRQEKAAKLYSAYRFPLLCNAIARHVQDVGQAYQMRAAA